MVEGSVGKGKKSASALDFFSLGFFPNVFASALDLNFGEHGFPGYFTLHSTQMDRYLLKINASLVQLKVDLSTLVS